MFETLTNKYVTVSNYPGTTVEVSYGDMTIDNKGYLVVDTPGVNSMVPMSEDEKSYAGYFFAGGAVSCSAGCRHKEFKKVTAYNPADSGDGTAGNSRP